MREVAYGLVVWSWLCLGFGFAHAAGERGADWETKATAFLVWPAVLPLLLASDFTEK